VRLFADSDSEERLSSRIAAATTGTLTFLSPTSKAAPADGGGQNPRGDVGGARPPRRAATAGDREPWRGSSNNMGDGLSAVFATPGCPGEPSPPSSGCKARPGGDGDLRSAWASNRPEIRMSDYFGPTLNRVAGSWPRPTAGQIVVSLPTQEIIRTTSRASEPPRPGRARLADLARPEHVFQVVIPAGDPPFPVAVPGGTRHRRHDMTCDALIDGWDLVGNW